jgi:hypothetical protein
MHVLGQAASHKGVDRDVLDSHWRLADRVAPDDVLRQSATRGAHRFNRRRRGWDYRQSIGHVLVDVAIDERDVVVASHVFRF